VLPASMYQLFFDKNGSRKLGGRGRGQCNLSKRMCVKLKRLSFHYYVDDIVTSAF